MKRTLSLFLSLLLLIGCFSLPISAAREPEIMPYYNERFKTIEVMAEIENPFDSVDMVETFEQETSQSSQSTGTTSQSGTNSQTMSTEGENSSSAKTTSDTATNTKQLTSDTPQNEISVGTKDIDAVGYASNAEWNEALSDSSQDTTTSETSSSETSSEGSNSSEGSSSDTSQSSGTIRHTLTRKGAQGVTTFGHDMIEFRDSIIDVMNEIITDERLNELFMMVY